jgi:hypothetical protein
LEEPSPSSIQPSAPGKFSDLFSELFRPYIVHLDLEATYVEMAKYMDREKKAGQGFSSESL